MTTSSSASPAALLAQTDAAELDKPLIVYVLGVAGSGRRPPGPSLAGKLACPYVDGLALLPWRARARFDAGHALEEDVRAKWLADVFDLAIKRLDNTPASAPHRPKRVVVSLAAVKRVHRRLAGGEGPDAARQTLEEAYRAVPPDARRATVRLALVYLTEDVQPRLGQALLGRLGEVVGRGKGWFAALAGQGKKARGKEDESVPSGPTTLAQTPSFLILALDRTSAGLEPSSGHKRTVADVVYGRLHAWLIGQL